MKTVIRNQSLFCLAEGLTTTCGQGFTSNGSTSPAGPKATDRSLPAGPGDIAGPDTTSFKTSLYGVHFPLNIFQENLQ